jgi:hypothetical protein
VSLDKGATKLSPTAYEILSYLVEHSRAQDTLEGIMQWWLLEQQIKQWIAQAQTALGELVAQGLALERKGRDGQIHYRVNRRRLNEIRALLAERGESEAATGSEPEE